ncbi:hypothetical protein PLEOSDRAFT_1113565 [Pleurotus ostreatus PC15]|uniref:G-protein coupled receptors family 1 profile domain-containing protein n=1 Tax=Pleurotus ostreatus (strain PC15) TaxID=1137138 RepID=A0A067NQ64_PLEO1|nr:hypothetical protein PLEOSDRAFT_1113565 [Pleurotus ostreatus PC15]
MVASRAASQTATRSDEALLNVWIYFNLVVNTILLPVLATTFLVSKRAKRHPTLVNVCMVWILSGFFSLLLFYAGQHDLSSPEPDKPLCVAQTSLLYGITPMWSVAVLMMVIHLNMAFDRCCRKDRLVGWRLVAMLSMPYLVLLAFFTATLTISAKHPERVTRSRRRLYCTLQYTPLFDTMAIFTAIVCLAITCLQGMSTHHVSDRIIPVAQSLIKIRRVVRLGTILYRNWRAIRSARRTDGSEIQLLLRVLIFGVYVFVGMIVNIFSIFAKSSAFPDIFAATIGTGVFLIFGTQPDVLRVWCFWLKEKPTKLAPIYISGEPNCGYNIDLTRSASPRGAEKGGFPGEKLSEIHLTPPLPVALPSSVHSRWH